MICRDPAIVGYGMFVLASFAFVDLIFAYKVFRLGDSLFIACTFAIADGRNPGGGSSLSRLFPHCATALRLCQAHR